MTSKTNDSLTSEKGRRRRPFVAFGLAALAVGGIGAAATSAAWTDNTFFAAPAAAATFDLQGSLDGATWMQSSSPDAVQLVIPATTFADLLPGQTRTVDLWVRNDSSVTAALTSTADFASGASFTTKPTVTVSDLAASLTPSTGAGAKDKFQLTITTPSDWAPSNQGKSGSIVVTIAATATS